MIFFVQAETPGSRSSRPDLSGSLPQTLGFSGVGPAAGAMGGYVSLVLTVFGLFAATIGGALLVIYTRRHRLAAGGGFLVGLGLATAWLLSPALTNRDPAVTYAPSTIPALIAGVFTALLGFAFIAGAVRRALRRRHRHGLQR